MTLPFYIGQPVDDVLAVAKYTGRRRLAVEFTYEGDTYRFDLDAPSSRQRRKKLAAMDAELESGQINLGKIPMVKYTYSDCVLTFERERGPFSGSYRIVWIESKEVA
jgi:hypothetical protein